LDCSYIELQCPPPEYAEIPSSEDRRTIVATRGKVQNINIDTISSSFSTFSGCGSTNNGLQHHKHIVTNNVQQRPQQHKLITTLIVVKYAVVPFISSVGDLVNLSRTCRELSLQLQHSALVREILLQNLSRLLSKFNFTVETLNNIFQMHHGTVLSGSTILQAYMGIVYSKYDLDFYIPFRTETFEFLKRCSGIESAVRDVYLIRNIPPVLEYFGLPAGIYRSAKIMKSRYFPEHFGFVLELIQDVEYISSRSGLPKYRLNKIQFIFVYMDQYSYPKEESCGFVVDYFDLSIVQNYFDGNNFCSRHIQHVLDKEMTINTRYSGVEEVSEVQMERLLKYTVKRGIKFLGPFLPLSVKAKSLYKKYLRKQKHIGAPILFQYTPSPKQPFSDEIITGVWITAAEKADAMFYDSDIDAVDKFRGLWRRRRRLAMQHRMMGRPNYKLEARIKDLMPKKYAIHRSIMLVSAAHTNPYPFSDVDDENSESVPASASELDK